MQKIEGSWQPRISATTQSHTGPFTSWGANPSLRLPLAPLYPPAHHPHSGSESFQKQGSNPRIPPGEPATAPMALGVKL